MARADSVVGTRRRTGQPARSSGASRLPARGGTADEQRALRAGRQAARARPALHRSLPRRPPGVGRARAVRAHARRNPDDLLHLLHARPDPGRGPRPGTEPREQHRPGRSEAVGVPALRLRHGRAQGTEGEGMTARDTPEADAVEQDDLREEETDRGGIVNEGDTSEVGRAWAIVEIQEDEVARLRAVVDAAHNWRDERDSKADSALIDALSTYDRFAPEPKP